MHLPTFSGKFGFARLALLLGLAVPGMAAPPAITSATQVDLFYDVENPGDSQFGYRIVATGSPVSFDASGLPPYATLDRATGWINGSRNVPGVYDVAVRATNADGTVAATVRLAIHPATIGVRSSPGVFRPGQTFSVTLNYNTAVVVTGVPRLTLAIGPAGAPVFKDAVYASGSGTSELVFQYAVTGGDDDADGVQLLPSAPTGGAIRDASGLAASPTLPVRYFVSGITIKPDSGMVTTSSASSVASTAQLTNVSARMRVAEGDGDGSRSLIAGFVVAGSQPKRVLLRAIGPALNGFGVQGALIDPRLRLYSSAGALVAENDNWDGNETSAVASAVGAFALSVGTRDSAVIVTLQPGAYTLVVSPNGGEGVALAEVYDADRTAGPGASAISNLSTRGQIDGDGSPLIAGFSVQGASAGRVLVRGIGPGLTMFGVGAALADVTLKIYRDGQLVAENDDWTSATVENTSAAAASGAFALAAGSKDAAIVLTLEPGSYTAVVSGVGNAAGAGLVEVYELPAKS
ncbi:MAG: putative Ig domain-containing protein [Opitutaceae bacterium]|nr:putative Ig domain-containing protein [Opitutaceae bacterium]